MACCAWCNFELATIFMALVILRVLLTEDIRFFTSLSEAIVFNFVGFVYGDSDKLGRNPRTIKRLARRSEVYLYCAAMSAAT